MDSLYRNQKMHSMSKTKLLSSHNDKCKFFGSVHRSVGDELFVSRGDGPACKQDLMNFRTMEILGTCFSPLNTSPSLLAATLQVHSQIVTPQEKYSLTAPFSMCTFILRITRH